MRHRQLLLLFLGMTVVIMACGSRPAVYFRPQTTFRPYKTLAILPFSNYSGQEGAGRQVANAFLVELLKKPFFHIVEPGEVDRVMREERIRSSEQIDHQKARIFEERLGADYILIGAVNEYSYLKLGNRDIPIVGFSARLVDFNWGLVSSLTKLARISVRDVVKRIRIHS